MTRRVKNVLAWGIKLALAGGIIGWLIASDKLTAQSFQPLLNHGWRLVACAGLLLMLPFLGALRWRMLLAVQGFDVPYLRVLHLGLVGVFFNSFGVGYVGGDVVKAYYAAVEQPAGRRAEAVTSVVFDRFVGLVGLLLFALIMMIAKPGTVWGRSAEPPLRLAGILVLTVLAAISAVFVLSFSRRLRESRLWTGWLSKLPGGAVIVRVYRAVAVYRAAPWTVLATVAISVAGHALNVAVLWQLAQALNFPPISPADFAFCIAVGLAATSVGLPMGIGVGQAAFGYLFSLFFGARGNVDGTALATMQQVMILFFNLAAGLPAFLLVRKDSARVRAEMDADAVAEVEPSGAAGVQDG